MKFYSSLFFALVASASAFVVPTELTFERQSSSGLKMSADLTTEKTIQAMSQSKAYQNLQASLTDKNNVAALEARLDALEQGKGVVTQGNGEYANKGAQIWETSTKIKVQGGSLKTWSFPSPLVQRVKVVLKTEGRPLNADVDLWQGPDNTPVKMRVYLEDGEMRPFLTSVETPRGPNTIAIRNTGHLEFPLEAAVQADAESESALSIPKGTSDMTIQGGALKTFPFDTLVQSVQVLLKTDGRPLNSRIELLQGPNNNKQVVELYTEDGVDRPFYMVLETPGSGNVVRILNTAPVEFPLTAWVQPYLVGVDTSINFEPVVGGDNDW